MGDRHALLCWLLMVLGVAPAAPGAGDAVTWGALRRASELEAQGDLRGALQALFIAAERTPHPLVHARIGEGQHIGIAQWRTVCVGIVKIYRMLHEIPQTRHRHVEKE